MPLFAPTAASRIGLALVACAALAAPHLAAAATEPEPGYAWRVAKPHGKVSLIYGSTEDIDHDSFFLFCDNGKKTDELSIYEEIRGAEAGQPLTIEISAGSAKIGLKGETAEDDMSGWIIPQAKAFAVKPVLAVLKGAGPLTVTAGEAKLTLPEQGRAAAVSQFASICTLD